jgi:hypothetical protein
LLDLAHEAEKLVNPAGSSSSVPWLTGSALIPAGQWRKAAIAYPRAGNTSKTYEQIIAELQSFAASAGARIARIEDAGMSPSKDALVLSAFVSGDTRPISVASLSAALGASVAVSPTDEGVISKTALNALWFAKRATDDVTPEDVNKIITKPEIEVKVSWGTIAAGVGLIALAGAILIFATRSRRK